MARKRKRSRFLRGALLGWLTAYFFDPATGRGRRTRTRDMALGRARHLLRRGERAQRYALSTAVGKAQGLRHRGGKEQPDDATLAHKVESVVFRDPQVPKGQINVDAADGVVTLRGEIGEQSLIDELVERARNVQGVRDVRSLLHLPGQPP